MMQDRRSLLINAVQRASADLLNHFQAQYGSLIFLPLGVNATTPAKIAPAIAESIERVMLKAEGEQQILLLRDAEVSQVFDAFITSFFNSLNFIAKGVMKALGMKMFWADFTLQLAQHQQSNPATYQKWKANLSLVLLTVFQEVGEEIKKAG